MRLLFDCTELSYYDENNGHRAGVFIVALNLFRELKRRGVDITFYCDFRRYYFMKNTSEFKDIPLITSYSRINRLIARILYLAKDFPYTIKTALTILIRIYDAHFFRKNRKSIKEIEGFDLYFSPYTAPSMDVQEAKIPKFRIIHDIIPILETGMAKNARDWYYKVYSTINDKDFYIANSECTRADVLKYFPFVKAENIKTALLGVNDNFKPSKSDEKRKYVFSLCTLGKRKNIIFAIKNFIRFIEKNKINDLYLVLGGSNWKVFEAELDKTINQYDKSKIILTGYIKDEDLPRLYSDALMFIYPSFYEGFGLPVLEAMKCGCPVITSNTSSIPEVIGNAGIKIDPKSDDELVSAYEKFYYDNFYRELCAERGIIRAREFRWEKCCDEILAFINEKLNQTVK